MACCNSYTECNELVTIGYLKNFIGTLIKDSNGNTVTISTSSADTYCPTYDEIKSLLPSHSEGASGPLDDVDGIVLNGSGSGTVKQSELSIEYTKWKGFTISADPTTIPQCGGSTTLSFTNSFTRYRKSMDSNCEVSTSSETVGDEQDSRVTFTTSSFGTISNNIMTVGENPHGTTGTAPARSTIVTGKMSFRGTEMTSTITITQEELGGEYRYAGYTDHGDPYSYAITCSVSSVPYSGGNASATGSYKIDYWDVYKWWDNCGHEFPGKTQNRNSRVSSFTESVGTHTFEALPCDGKGSSYTFEYHGKSCSTTQDDNPNSCNPCPPKNYTSYTDVTVDCSVGSATVYGEWHHFSGGELDEEGNCVGYTHESGTTQYTKTWDCSTPGGQIDEHIFVTGAPCCSEFCEYRFDDIEIPCDEAGETFRDATYTEICHHTDGTTTTSTGSTRITIDAVKCNKGNSRTMQNRIVGRSLATSQPKIVQLGGCECPCLDPSTTYVFADVEIPCTSAGTTSKMASYSAITTYSNCETEILTDAIEVNVPAVSCNSGDDIEIQPGNTGTTLSQASPRIVQKGGCQCYCLDPSTVYTLADVELECEEAGSFFKSVSYTAVTTYSNCSADTITSTTTVRIPAVSCNSGGVIEIQPGNTGATLSQANPRITQKGGCTCTSCTCNDLTIGSNSEVWDYDNREIKRIPISSDCVTNIGINSIEHFNAVLNNNNIEVSPKGVNTTISAYTDVLTVSAMAENTLCEKSITLTQSGITPCEPSESYEYSALTLPCTASPEKSYNVEYIKRTRNADCTDTVTTGVSAVTLPAIECNSGDNRAIAHSTLVITQSGGCDCFEYTCSSFDVVFDSDCIYGQERAFPAGVFSEFTLLKIVPKSGQNFFNDDVGVSLRMDGNPAATAYTNCRLDITGNGDNKIGAVKVSLGKTNGETGLTSVFILCIGTLECELWRFTRICPGVTDNCTYDAVDATGNAIKVVEPMYMHSRNEDITTYYAPSRNSDSLLISQVGGSHISAKTSESASELKLVTSEYTWDEEDDGSFTGYTGTTWWKGTYGDGGWLNIYIGNNNTMLMYGAQPNYSDSVRSATCTFYTDGNQEITTYLEDHRAWLGQNACIATEVEIWQAPKDCRWSHYNPRRYNENGAEIRPYIPLDGPVCGIDSFTFEDNIPASGGYMVIGHCTLEGSCSLPSTLLYDSGDEILEEGITVVDNVIYGTVKPNTDKFSRSAQYTLTYGNDSMSATITQLGTGLDPCAGVLTMYTNIPSTGVTNDKVGEYTTTGSCSNVRVVFVDGDNFITNPTVGGDGYIYGSCQSTNYRNVGRYVLYAGDDVISQPSEAKQLEACNITNFSLSSNVDATGGTDVTIGAYQVVGSCTLPTTITYVRGDGDFLSRVRIPGNTIIADIANNAGSTSRSSWYSISYGGSTAEAVITQLGVEPTPPSNCEVSMALIDDAPAAGSGRMYVGEWHTTGSCTPPTTLTYIGGDGDFLSGFELSSNNAIYAAVSQNTSELPRSSWYKIEYGDSEYEARIVQLGTEPTPPSECEVSMALIDNAPAAGSGRMYVGEWHTTGSCGTPAITYIGGDGDFLSGFDLASNNGIYAAVSQNESTSTKSSWYRITYGGTVDEAKITQLGSDPTPVECEISMGLIKNAPASGNSFMRIGDWHTTGSCTPPTAITYISGDGDFLSGIEVRSDNVIYAAVSRNTSTSPRSSSYRIEYGDSAYDEDNIMQLGGEPCTGTLSMYSNIDAYGTAGDVVGSYTLSEWCSSDNVRVVYDSGDDFLYGLTAGDGYVSASCDINDSGVVKSGTYSLVVDSNVIARSTASQATVEPGECDIVLTMSEEINPYGVNDDVVGTYQILEGDCSGNITVSFGDYMSNFLTDLRASNGKVYGSCDANYTVLHGGLYCLYVNGVQKSCSTAYQDVVGSGGFDAQLTIAGLEDGAAANINWGDETSNTFGNGTISHSYQSDRTFTATITADGYNRETVLFASNDREKSVTMQKSTPGGFDATLTLSGLDSAIATVDWGDEIVEYNVGNGSTIHNYHSDGSFSVTVTASGYITKTTSFIKGSAESQTIAMEKSAPTGCNCESAEIGDMQANRSIESSTQSRVTIATFTSSTECSSSDFTFARVNGDNIAISITPLTDGEGNYTITAAILDNTGNDPRSETLGIYINNVLCSEFEIIQNAASTPTGFYATLTISGLEDGDTATVDWDDGSAENVGNGDIGHSYQTDGPFSVTITAEGYVNKTTSFVKDSAESQSIEMRKSSPAPTSFYVTLRVLGLDDVTATVDWGDGDIETGIGNGYTGHTYEIEGNTFNVVITANGYVTKTTSFVRDSVLIREVEMEKYAPTPTGFMATLTISGLEGNDRATIDWGDYSHETVDGNDTLYHNYQSDGSFSVTVTASGYITKTTSFIKDSAESQTIIMQKSAPPVECSCDTIQMPDVDFDSNDTSSVSKDCEIYNAPEGCIINVRANDTEHFAITANTTGITVSPNSNNPYEEPYADIITVVLTFSDSSTCTKELTAIQYGVTPSTGFYGTLTINGLGNSDTVTVYWGDETSTSNVGNGTITHYYQVEEATVTVMSPKYEIYSTNLSRGGSEAETVPMEQLSIGFTARLTINGLEGDDKASIDWGDNKSDSNVGNTTKFHTYKLLDDADVIVTADGYTTQTINLSKDGVTDYTMTMVKVTQCDCNDISISDVEFEWNNTEASTVEVHDPTDCIESVSTYDDTDNFWIAASTTTVSVQPKDENTSASPIEDTVSITFTLSDGTECTVEFTARQNGKSGDGCSSLTLQLN